MLPATAPVESKRASVPSELNEFIISSFEPMLTPIRKSSKYMAYVISFSLAVTIRCLVFKRKPSSMPPNIIPTTSIKSAKFWQY